MRLVVLTLSGGEPAVSTILDVIKTVLSIILAASIYSIDFSSCSA
ncbi:MAG: hypothetical protein QXK71_03970 [Pyrobaculum sp.]